MVSVTRNVGVRVEAAGHWNVFDRRLIHWRLNGPQRAQQLLSITELRLGVEPLAAKLAAQRIEVSRGSELMRLAGALVAAGNAGDLESFLLADMKYHALILRASGNEMFAHLHEAVGEVLRGRTEHGLMPERPDSQARHWHLGVADAIQRGNQDQAEEQMRRIVLLADQEMRAQLG
nr:FCD domain-containing protein [Psychromicrobium silvestre]